MDIISDRLVKTRKPHKCWGCADLYPIGSNIRLLSQVDGGEIITTYWCDVCDSYWKEYMQDCEGIFMGDLACEQHYKDYRKQWIKQQKK